MTSARTTFAVLPQRRAAGWQNCPPHLAQRWAVVKLTLHGRARHEKVISAFPTRAEADALCARYHALALKDEAKRKAQRDGLPSKGGAVIARSLSIDEYNQLTQE